MPCFQNKFDGIWHAIVCLKWKELGYSVKIISTYRFSNNQNGQYTYNAKWTVFENGFSKSLKSKVNLTQLIPNSSQRAIACRIPPCLVMINSAFSNWPPRVKHPVRVRDAYTFIHSVILPWMDCAYTNIYILHKYIDVKPLDAMLWTF